MSALSAGLSSMRERRSGHDPGRMVSDLAVLLADGGECLSDMGRLRDQMAPFGEVAFNASGACQSRDCEDTCKSRRAATHKPTRLGP